MNIPIDASWIEAVMLASVRLAAFILVAPPFSYRAIPGTVKALLAVGPSRIEDVAPLFAALLSIPFGERYPTLSLSPMQHRRRTLAALLDQFEGLARRQPILLSFEDAQWADATSLELLNLMVERVRQLPVLALLTFRPDFEPPWVGLPNVSNLTLGRLPRRYVESMVTQVAVGRVLPVEVMKQFVAKTDGNPLFIEEHIRSLLQSGALQGEPLGRQLAERDVEGRDHGEGEGHRHAVGGGFGDRHRHALRVRQDRARKSGLAGGGQ